MILFYQSLKRVCSLALVLCASIISLAAVDEDSPLSVFGEKPKAEADALERSTRASIVNLAQRLDGLISIDQQVNEVTPNAITDDETFVRRMYLETIGRIPTRDEAITFIDSSHPEKRYDLIDMLLNSEGYASHQFNFWADLLRLKSRLNGGVPAKPYIDWVKQSLRDNKPYNDFVREMLTSEGSAWDEGNGATGYYIRDAGMALDNMANTVQVFLGTRVACAQCHDHPFDKWTRHDFLSLAAFTSGVNARAGGLKQARAVRKILGNELKEDQYLKNAVRKLNNGIAIGVRDSKKGKLRLPKDYQYDDGKPGDMVEAHTIFGQKITLHKGDDPRAVYADWLTSSDNPRFALVIANRLWKKSMGVGLIEPVDNITDKTEPSNKLLMSFLEQNMKLLKYDLKQFQRMIYYTQCYQREAFTEDWNQEEAYHYPGPLLHRMTSEQLWDSMLTIAMPAVDERKAKRGVDYYEVFQILKNMKPKELANVARVTAKTEKESRRLQVEVIRPLVTKVNKLKKERADWKILKPIYDEINLARKKSDAYREGFRFALGIEVDDGGMDMMMMKMEGVNYKKMKKKKGDPRWQGFNKDMYRASELQAPMNPGHFLRQFGQSDREQIDNSNNSASVTQVLAMLNGFTQKQILNGRSVLMKNIKKAKTVDDRVNTIFLSILGRYPHVDEMRLAEWGVSKFNSAYYTDLASALVNTREFIFVQ
ncbi:MAG: DUF1549 domain-containing protein [Planctomycetes bacterium]|nr:DUF1549 domain-containing protein [Planctomycetota bacterium]